MSEVTVKTVDHTVIVGGGPVGATLALSLATKGVPLTILEARKKGAAYPDGRALALSYGSKMILDHLGVWDVIAAKVTEINTIHISQKGSLGRSVIKAHEHDLPSLGYVVSYGVLSKALDEALAQHDNANVIHQAEVTSLHPQATDTLVDYQCEGEALQISTPLAALADGGRSLNDIDGLTRKVKAYGHDAVVTKVKAELPHNNIAYERFTPQGPMALLPNGASEFSLVWTGEAERVAPLLDLEDSAFLAQLHAAFGDRVGQFLTVGKRMSFPLTLATIEPATLPNLAVIGNAAQTMHPVAGQGFNVGMRDAAALAKAIASTEVAQLGNAEMLEAYAQSRTLDTKRGLQFTDFLINVFSNDLIGLHGMRSKGLAMLDIVKPAKNFVVERMSYGK